MASTSVTTYTHVCDLCGKSETTTAYSSPYRKLYADRARSLETGGSLEYVACDICADCRSKSIGVLMGWFLDRQARC